MADSEDAFTASEEHKIVEEHASFKPSNALDEADFKPGNSLLGAGLDGFEPSGSLFKGSTSLDEDTGFTPSNAFDADFTPLGSNFEPSNTLDDEFTPGNSLFGGSKLVGGDSFEPSGSLGVNDDDDLPALSTIRPSSTSTSTRIDDTASDYLPWNTVRARTFDGKSLHIKRKSKVSTLARLAAQKETATTMTSLLDVPIHRLLESLARLPTNTAHPPSSTLPNNTHPTPNNTHPTPNANASPSESSAQLFTDTYRPQRFTDLLGNDRVCRDAMAWLKTWDRCVFGASKGKGKSMGKGEDGEEMDVFGTGGDEWGRPRDKVLMLSGPPGLGKTTLAHIIARHAGYEVLEINASDARSGSIIDDRIRPALEAGKAVKGSGRPVLVVIDEIDGATGAGDNTGTFIHKLVQLITAKSVKSRKSSSSSKRPENQAKPLLRPIICIANDQYASALAKLRGHVYQLRVQRPADIHIVRRLREVCASEGMKADSRALGRLVGAARGDLRGCLNMLQFIKSKHTSRTTPAEMEITDDLVRRATVGMKESESTLMGVVNDLFAPLSRKRLGELGLSEEMGMTRYVGRLAGTVGGSGREGGVALGCFAHYLTRRKHDSSLLAFQKGIDWLGTYDLLSSAMWNEGEFALQGYLPYMLVGFFPLFGERGMGKVERDSADWDALQRIRANEEIYKTLAKCVHGASLHAPGDWRHFAAKPLLQLEFAPFLNRIINPPLRPVNSQVIKPQEKKLLARLVEIMVALDMNFLREREEDGQLVYRLEPPIDVFVTYDGKRAADIPISRYAVRQLVSQEIEMKAVSHHADFVEKESTSKRSFAARFSSKRRADGDDGDSPNKRARTAEAVDIVDRPPVDFFGRLIVKPVSRVEKGQPGEEGAKEKSGFTVLYKYTEGNSAAVRRPVKVGVFL
ncbi:hypothetical protein BDV98DRAFT_548919 [Pterulicium gracile]|uniref:AAA+ ATPase domain-containing protein n=1 Tax=Pterulicium gracile TaxID=1884261 RepID=A0A5C3QH87_9AGAR|nr:hypothetical protein BDV98DRAFT_548919 [Pterula gracilis]